MATEFKNKGNSALQQGNIDEAVDYYTKAIKLESDNHLLYSNRSAAYSKANKYEEALKDAEQCISLKPSWSKGYSRKGAALEFLGKLDEAKSAYETGLKFEPDNLQIKSSLASLEDRMMETDAAGAAPSMNLNTMFSDPRSRAKLESHPRTKGFFNDASFKFKLDMIQKNPKVMQSLLQDQQIMDCLAVLLDINPDDIQIKSQDEESLPKTKKAEEPKKEEMDVGLTTEQNQALVEKDLGNIAYKAKDFDTAIKHYDAAITSDPENCTLYSNKAAVFFETGQFEDCIKLCEKCVEVGRENRADYKVIAKAYARIANSYIKLEDLKKAKKFFDKSLSEFRTPDVLKKSQELDKTIKEQEKKAYINPEIAEEEKSKGNQLFQKGKFPQAMKHYDEAIKRNPDDPKLYSNRAACLTKLMEFPSAVRDCDTCIKLDPNFVKGYLRKAAALIAMKDTTKAAEAYRKALNLDPNCQEAQDGLRKTYMSSEDPEESRKKAMHDPEIQNILSDPAMQIILSQMQKDPQALREHLQNPDVAEKLQKLMAAGFISVR